MKRLYHVDFLRFAASFMVVLHHYCFRGSVGESFIRFKFEEYKILYSISKYGFLGVEFFFVLSGFVITQAVLKSNNSYDFFTKRIVRIYPAFIFCCLLTFIVLFIFKPIWFDLDIIDLVLNMTFLNFPFRSQSVDEVYWTLHLEILFYLWCTLLIIMSKDRMKGMKFFFVLSIFFYFYDLKYVSQILISKYIPFFFLGFSIYNFKVNRKTEGMYSYLILSISFILACYAIANEIVLVSNIYEIYFNPIVGVFIIFLSSFIFLFSSSFNCKYLNKSFTILGAISYPLYLLHQKLGYFLLDVLIDYMGKLNALFLTITLMILISYIVAIFIEPYLSRLLKIILWRNNDVNKA